MLVLHFTDCITVKYFEDLLNFQQQNGSCFLPKCDFSVSGHTYFLLKFRYSENATKFEEIFHLKFDATQ